MQSKRPAPLYIVASVWRSGARSVVPGWALLGLACLLLLSCAHPGGTPGATARQTSTTPTNYPLPTATSSLTQQYSFTAQDSGRSVRYVATSRFEIWLNQQQYPQKNLQVLCTPSQTLANVTDLPPAPPLYVVRYQGDQPGVCTIENGTFHLYVTIVPLEDS